MIDEGHRAETVMMARIRNEGRWIRRCLERTFLVAKTVVIWDDGSNDNTYTECVAAVGHGVHVNTKSNVHVSVFSRPDGSELHYLESPFRFRQPDWPPPHLRKFQVNEIRDKNALWEYVKACVGGKYFVCQDGDEMLSRRLVAEWHQVSALLDNRYDIVHLPLVYLWDSEGQRRVDGIYGDIEPGGLARLNFPRVFTTLRWTEQDIFDSHFGWQGSKGGFHCGSIPKAQAMNNMVATSVIWPIVHFGYIDDELRQSKFKFYNQIDPSNVVEGEYKHVIGEPALHAPGPVQLVPWSDQ
jgi:hypothetical protein